MPLLNTILHLIQAKTYVNQSLTSNNVNYSSNLVQRCLICCSNILQFVFSMFSAVTTDREFTLLAVPFIRQIMVSYTCFYYRIAMNFPEVGKNLVINSVKIIHMVFFTRQTQIIATRFTIVLCVLRTLITLMYSTLRIDCTHFVMVQISKAVLLKLSKHFSRNKLSNLQKLNH